MKITILGAAGFIGTNLAIALAKQNQLLLVDESIDYFTDNPVTNTPNVKTLIMKFDKNADFNKALKDANLVFHLISTNNPTTSNKDIGIELEDNVGITVNILEACRKNNVNKIVFLSSGGTIYGEGKCPLSEDDPTNPITTYGIQKLAIEKILYLYNYLYSIDYRIVRLANPYGPYQRPNGKLGAITTFTYKVLKGQSIEIYGDGSNVRDYIYIDDAIMAIINVSTKDTKYKVYNIGSGKGTSLIDVIECIKKQLKLEVKISFSESRSVDLKQNYLDSSRYIEEFGNLVHISLEEGILLTASFLKEHMFR